MCDDPCDETQLLEAYYGCSEDAFTTFHDSWFDRLVRLARCHLRVVQDAEDAAQNALSKVSRTKNRPTTRFNPEKASLKTWVNTILFRETIEVLRALSRTWPQSELLDDEDDEKDLLALPSVSHESHLLETALDTGSSPLDKAITAENDARLRACCGELPEPYATVMRLRYWDELKLKEIAEILQKSTTWVHQKEEKGLKLLLDEYLRGKIHLTADRRKLSSVPTHKSNAIPMDKNQLSQMLHRLAAQDRAEWESERYGPPVPEGCPSMPRMYAAVLREDWTWEELAAIRANPIAQKLSEKVRAGVWYPTLLQLVKYQYLPATLSEDEKTDITYHLETDRCKRSLRMLRWAGTAAAIGQIVARVNRGTPGAMEELEQRLAKVVSFRTQVEPGVLSAGLFEHLERPQRTISDDGQVEATLSRGAGSQLRLTLEDSSEPAGTLLRVALADDDGAEVWQGFVMLRRIGEVSVGNATLDIGLAGNCSLVSEVRGAEELVAADADLLSSSFARAQEDDLPTVPVWRGWAEAVCKQCGLGRCDPSGAAGDSIRVAHRLFRPGGNDRTP